jgi:hypothetical protein
VVEQRKPAKRAKLPPIERTEAWQPAKGSMQLRTAAQMLQQEGWTTARPDSPLDM